MKQYLLFWVLLFPLLGMYAQDGTPDSTFNSIGWKNILLGKANNYDDEGYNVMKQSDGKYLFLDYIGGQTSLVVRYNTNGTIDNSYGTGGFSDLAGDVYFHSAAIQSDDKVVVGGYYYMSDINFAVARYKTNGTLDSSFGTNGMTMVPIAPYTSITGQAVTVDSSGRIVLAGGVYSYSSAIYSYLVARFTTDGVLDVGFNSGGIATVTFGENSMLSSIVIQTDGKVVIGGTSLDPYTYNFDLARFISDGAAAGTLDPEFGVGGTVTSSLGGGLLLDALAIQSDNKILAGGAVQMLNKKGIYVSDFVLMRYLANGTLDPDFNSGSTFTGTVITDLGGSEGINSIALKNNTIVAAGTIKGRTPSSIGIVRYLMDGTLDKTFDKDGILISSFTGDDLVNSVLVDNSNAILIAGGSFNTSVGNEDALLVRYSSSGALDKTFNSTGATPGLATLYYSVPQPSLVTGVAVQPDGKIVIGGTTMTQDPNSGLTDYQFTVTRLYPDGTPDNNFGNGGVAVASFGAGMNAIGFCLAIAPVTGKIVVGGFIDMYNAGTDEYDFALAQFTSAGVLDKSFGKNGLVTTYVNNYSIFSMAIQADGKIVAGGPLLYNNFGNADFLLARYTTTGSLDRTFGGTGTVTVDFLGYEDQLLKLALQADGKIVAVGGATNTNTTLAELALVRVTTDGVPDATFGTNGKVLAAVPGNNAIATSFVFQENKIVVFGIVADTATDSSYVVLTRYTDNGVVDETFGAGGIVSVSYTGYNPNNSLFGGALGLLQSDGKLIVVTQLNPWSEASNEIDRIGATRFSSSGSLDDTWGTSGNMISDLPEDLQLITACWNNGRMYTGGIFSGKDLMGFLAVYKAGSTQILMPSVSIDDVSVPANAGTATLTVSMNATSTSPIIVNYATKDNTATSKGKNPDYKSAKGTVTILPGTYSATIAIPIYSVSSQTDKSFFVNLSLNTEMAKLVTLDKATGTVTITYSAQFTRLDNQDKEQVVAGKLAVKAMPNPSTGVFNLELQSAVNAPASIRIMDISGRLIESKTGVSPNRSIQLGSNYKPGAYYAEVIQGNEKVVLKLVKQ